MNEKETQPPPSHSAPKDSQQCACGHDKDAHAGACAALIGQEWCPCEHFVPATPEERHAPSSDSNNGGWISVKDRLPETVVDVLLYTLTDGVDHGWWDGRKWVLYRSNPYNETIEFDPEQVTHWQPQPLPPQF